ncbi:zinc ABC transporter ATPase [Candidatus Paracaedimonas acanthamoebae]|nr:zinc ABC transporter ATPase [Candidatus Paracaedimonas acanthamoebae]
MKNTIISLDKISYQKGDVTILHDVSLAILAKELVTVIGPNGAGKTTLLKVILGLLTPTGGKITKLSALKIGYMPQKLHMDPSLPITVKRFLEFSRYQDALHEVVTAVGIDKLLEKSIHILSGGELQRILLARALLGKPDLLVLDEPLQGVDINGQVSLYKLIYEVRQILGCAVLLVSHDLHFVHAASDKVICLNHHICCAGKPEEVKKHPNYQSLFSSYGPEILAPYAHSHNHSHDIDNKRDDYNE